LFPIALVWIKVPVKRKGTKPMMAEVTWKGPHACSRVMSTGRMYDSGRYLLWRQCTVTQKTELEWAKLHQLF
jgi:hypothetical protein